MQLESNREIEERNVWKSFLFNISSVVGIFIIGIFIGLFLRNRELIENETIHRSRAHLKNIILTRNWNSRYGGVYVEKTEGVESNPYLEKPDIVMADGTVYTMKNPELMAREISEFAVEDGMFTFHISSLKPLNPNNLPDEFEKKALLMFERGETEYFEKIDRENQTIFRYIAPIVVEGSCLECHEKQGYQVGDIRGGISVSYDITNIDKSLKRNTFLIIVVGLFSLVLLLGAIYHYTFVLMKRLNTLKRNLEILTVTDPLTQIYNRRYFFQKLQEEFQRAKRYSNSLSCLMIDLDHFKDVNDCYGHQAGDIVLQNVSKILKANIRDTDTLARYGGEEFVVLLLESDRENTLLVAEKLRQIVEEWK